MGKLFTRATGGLTPRGFRFASCMCRKALFAGLLLSWFGFQAGAQNKNAAETLKTRPLTESQTNTPFRPSVEKEELNQVELSKKFEGYLIVVQNAGINEEVPVPFRKSKLIPVDGNSKVTVMQFDNQADMKKWAPVYLQDYKVMTADRKTLSARLKSLGASLSSK